jgi:hypothetical protein
MSLIDSTYFIGEINIAQISQPSVDDVLTGFITKYETKYLNEVLGYAFAKLFSAGLTVTPTVDARWTKLKTGAEFTSGEGFLTMWPGFVNDDLQSPIANYIYFWFCRNNVSFTAGMGEVEGATENGSLTTGNTKLTRAWNEMVDMNCALYDFLMNAKNGDGSVMFPEFTIDAVKHFAKINPFGI